MAHTIDRAGLAISVIGQADARRCVVGGSADQRPVADHWWRASHCPVCDHEFMGGGAASGARPGWVRDASVPGALDELRGPLQGSVGLPARLFWSGPDPRAVRWNLADPARRRDLYEIVLVEGTLDDIRALVDGPELVRLWERMYLPPWVRAAWRPLIDAARPAA